jgi:hypothetical protein
MKSFKQYINEETMPYASTSRGAIDVSDDASRDGLNSLLTGVTNSKFLTPYIALERVSKVLANFHIFIPKHSFLQGNSGMFIWPINQFGLKFGQTNDGKFMKDGEVLKDSSKGDHEEGEDFNIIDEPETDSEDEYSVFFEYQLSDCGMYEVFCEIVDKEELEDLLDDVEEDLNDDTEDDEKETVSEETTDNDAPLANRNTMKGASTPVPSSFQHKQVPTRNTKDLDKMNRDNDGNTVVEDNLQELTGKGKLGTIYKHYTDKRNQAARDKDIDTAKDSDKKAGRAARMMSHNASVEAVRKVMPNVKKKFFYKGPKATNEK